MGLLTALMVMTNMGLIYAEITCEAPTVRTGDPAYIICLFDVDVSVAKKNIKVQRRSLTSARFDPDKTDTVLDCYWQNAADFSCQFGNGFKLVGEAGRTAVVRIASASKNDEQVYMCEVVPSDPTNIQTCTLTVRDPTACDGNCSNINVVPKRLEDDAVKGIVTAIIIIICVIVILVLFVLLICFRKQLKENLRKWWPPASTPKKNNDNIEAAVSIDHDGDEDNTTEDLKDNEQIERYIRLLLRMKEAGKLNEFYNVSHSAEKDKSVSDLVTCSASLSNRRHSSSHRPAVDAEEYAGRGCGASRRNDRPERENKLSNDPDGLHITAKQWYDRELAELRRKKEEVDARHDLYTAREKLRHEISKGYPKKNNKKKNQTDANADPKKGKKWEEAEKKTTDAEIKLEYIMNNNFKERARQEEEDRKRLDYEIQMLNKPKKPNQPVEETRQLLIVKEGDRDTIM